MFSCGRLTLLAIAACLLLASGAGAAVPGSFTAAVTPTAVKPNTSAPYTITLTNSLRPTSEREADRAKIGIPPGFAVDAGSVQATSSASTDPDEDCVQATWVADSDPIISDNKIHVRSPSGGNSNRLCPGATLTISFSATSPAVEDAYTWAPELLRGDGDPPEIFTLTGPEPTVRVDGTPPTVTIGQKPSNPSNSSAATFSFTVGGESIGAPQCRLDNAAFASCPTPRTYANLGDGPHTFTVQATDAAGNIGQASYTWTIETRTPTAAVSSGPAALTNSRSATFVFSADEPSSFECQLDGGSFLPCSSPASYQGLGDGSHSFAVRPRDAVGNTGAAASHGWRIDATAPQTRVASGPRNRTTSRSATFTFSASEQAAFQCKLDAGAFAACTSPKTYARIRRSAHTFQVRAVDAAGNVDPTPAVLRWTIAAVTRRTKATSALLSPRAGARVTGAPLLVWRPVARASYYNVQLFRGKTKVLSAWPTRARFRLRPSWTYLGRQQRLAPGTYRWFVWPRLGRGAKGRYGSLLGQSTFTVAARR